MSSRDPDELRDELQSIDFGGDAELLSELRTEARETVTGQKETLADIDSKASKILRLNVLLVGVIVSALSIVAKTGGTATAENTRIEGSRVLLHGLLNPYTGLGVGSLLISTALAAMTYTVSELDVGTSSDNLTNLLRADLSTQQARELLVKNYIVRINFNRSTNIRNTPLITATIVFLVAGILFFAVGAYEATVGAVPGWLAVSAVGILFGVVWISGLAAQTRRAIRDIREWR
ncbi:hypothetical protein [Halorussus salinus]|uniref:hypothetical protein n=1 Tax=Halorussus salinus TaxID=1364935 RepID=UPI001092D7C5|nr:hypothetical protein [Halorussus salinus]